jgi:hypothetical protein
MIGTQIASGRSAVVQIHEPNLKVGQEKNQTVIAKQFLKELDKN